MSLSHVLRRPRAPGPGRCRRDPARPDAIPCRSRAASAIGPAHLELDRGSYGQAHQGCLGLASCLHPHLVDTSERNESIGARPPKTAPNPQIPIGRRANQRVRAWRLSDADPHQAARSPPAGIRKPSPKADPTRLCHDSGLLPQRSMRSSWPAQSCGRQRASDEIVSSAGARPSWSAFTIDGDR